MYELAAIVALVLIVACFKHKKQIGQAYESPEQRLVAEQLPELRQLRKAVVQVLVDKHKFVSSIPGAIDDDDVSLEYEGVRVQFRIKAEGLAIDIVLPIDIDGRPLFERKEHRGEGYLVNAVEFCVRPGEVKRGVDHVLALLQNAQALIERFCYLHDRELLDRSALQ